MNHKRLVALASAVVGIACTKPSGPRNEAATTAPSVATPSTSSRTPPFRWPTAPEEVAPPGFAWRTVHHETIHARFVVPEGARVMSTRDANGYPRVDIDVDGENVVLQFDSGVGQLANTLKRTPPTVYGLPTERTHLGPENVATRYRMKDGALRISGFAPGVKCSFEAGRVPAERVLERIFTVCASLRSPAFGSWREATTEERSHGGLTDVPEGAWVESSLPAHPGAVLRSSKFVGRVNLGYLIVSGAECPASADELRKHEVHEVEVTVDEKSATGGTVWVRRATEVHDVDRLPGTTTVFARRQGRCCRASFIPWTMPPSAGHIDYALALCETFR